VQEESLELVEATTLLGSPLAPAAINAIDAFTFPNLRTFSIAFTTRF